MGWCGIFNDEGVDAWGRSGDADDAPIVCKYEDKAWICYEDEAYDIPVAVADWIMKEDKDKGVR